MMPGVMRLHLRDQERSTWMTVRDVLEYLASGMTPEEFLEDFPYLTKEDILACLSYAADREKRLMVVACRMMSGLL